MTDVLTVEQRRLNMSRIRGRDTAPELRVRRGLHAEGLRFRLHPKQLPGRPDLIFVRYRTAVFIHGCFWHAHGCRLSKMPATRQEFWRQKLEGNAARDLKVVERLQATGWRVLVIWECALRGPSRREEADVIERAVVFIRYGQSGSLQIDGNTVDSQLLSRRNCESRSFDSKMLRRSSLMKRKTIRT